MVTIRFSNAIAFVLIFLSNFCGLQAATFTVTNNSDSAGTGSGSLRQAILDVNSSGDVTNEIVVALSGSGGSTIFLQSALPAINNQVHLNGSDQNSSEILTVDGSIAGNLTRGLEINGAAASNCLIESLGIQNITNTGSAYGILITNQAVNCSVIYCVIDTIGVGTLTNSLAGIFMSDDALYSGEISYNQISNIGDFSLSSSPNNAYGIFIDGDMGQGSAGVNCVGNVIKNVFGRALMGGIRAHDLYGNCSGNSIKDMINNTPIINGIEFENIYGNISHNLISNLKAVFSFTPTPDVFGIQVNDTVYGDVTDNCVTTLLCDDGNVVGISLETVMGSILRNTICDLTRVAIPTAIFFRELIGIRVSATLNGDLSYNCIKTLSSILSSISGVEINSIEGSISYNKLSDFAAEQDDVNGFVVTNQFGLFNCNEMRNFSTNSGNSNSAFNVTGFLNNNIAEPVEVIITNNTITQLFTEGALQTGEVIGISIPNALQVSGIISGNTISELSTGQATEQGTAQGISVREADRLQFTCNTIINISGGANSTGINTGIVINNAVETSFSRNTIKNVMAQQANSTAHGIICGVNAKDTAIDCLFDKNLINQITAESLQAYGITVGGSGSIPNKILNNSISNIDTAAIFYSDNAPTDGVVQLSLIECSGRSVTISGTISPDGSFLDTDFLVQFFVSPLFSPVQTKFFIGEQIVSVGNVPTSFTVTFEPSMKIFDSQFVTATATALPGGTEENKNTSVVSNALFGCSTSVPGLCNIVSTCPNDDSLPSVDCPLPNCVLLPECGTSAGNC